MSVLDVVFLIIDTLFLAFGSLLLAGIPSIIILLFVNHFFNRTKFQETLLQNAGYLFLIVALLIHCGSLAYYEQTDRDGQIKQRGYEEGYSEGYSYGLNRFLSEYNEEIDRLHELLIENDIDY